MRMDFWVSPIETMGRDVRDSWVGFAHFETYRPSAGLHEDFPLSEAALDTMVTVYAPPSCARGEVFCASPGLEGLFDLRLTIRRWLEDCGAGSAVSHASWTGELEKDLATGSPSS